jgi:hypothetical protein
MLSSLTARVHVSDLVQIQGSPLATSRRPAFRVFASVKAPLSWPKSSLDERLGKSGAIDLDERLVARRSRRMVRATKSFPSRFPFQEDRGCFALGDLLDPAAHFLIAGLSPMIRWKPERIVSWDRK